MFSFSVQAGSTSMVVPCKAAIQLPGGRVCQLIVGCLKAGECQTLHLSDDADSCLLCIASLYFKRTLLPYAPLKHCCAVKRPI